MALVFFLLDDCDAAISIGMAVPQGCLEETHCGAHNVEQQQQQPAPVEVALDLVAEEVVIAMEFVVKCHGEMSRKLQKSSGTAAPLPIFAAPSDKVPDKVENTTARTAAQRHTREAA